MDTRAFSARPTRESCVVVLSYCAGAFVDVMCAPHVSNTHRSMCVCRCKGRARVENYKLHISISFIVSGGVSGSKSAIKFSSSGTRSISSNDDLINRLHACGEKATEETWRTRIADRINHARREQKSRARAARIRINE